VGQGYSGRWDPSRVIRASELKTTKTSAVEQSLDAFKLNLATSDAITAKRRRAEAFTRDAMPILAEFDALAIVNTAAKNDLDWDGNGLPVSVSTSSLLILSNTSIRMGIGSA
jgi:hypothetical protein